MKSLLEVQQDIRSLEHSINEIGETVKSINSDIEELRTVNQNTEIDYSNISFLSKQLTFGKHPISKLDDGRACRMYLETLLNIVRLDMDEEITLNRLVFIQWIQKKSGIDWTLEDLFIDCYKISNDFYYEIADIIPKKYHEHLIVDALIVANIGGAAIAEINEFVSALVSLLGVKKKKLRILSSMARAVLCQNVKCLKMKELEKLRKCAESYEHYIKADILEDAVLSIRRVVVEIPESSKNDFKWIVKHRQAVEKNDVIATEQINVWYSPIRTEEIKAPDNGTIFILNQNGINYGVLSDETDNKNSIIAWIKAKG